MERVPSKGVHLTFIWWLGVVTSEFNSISNRIFVLVTHIDMHLAKYFYIKSSQFLNYSNWNILHMCIYRLSPEITFPNTMEITYFYHGWCANTIICTYQSSRFSDILMRMTGEQQPGIALWCAHMRTRTLPLQSQDSSVALRLTLLLHHFGQCNAKETMVSTLVLMFVCWLFVTWASFD